jgi:hypothetical protein
MDVAVLFNPISNFETAHSAFPLDKDSEQIRYQNLKASKAHEIAVAALFEVKFYEIPDIEPSGHRLSSPNRQ